MKLRQWLVAVKVDKSREKENFLLSDNVGAVLHGI